jgi:hypothetical protein
MLDLNFWDFDKGSYNLNTHNKFKYIYKYKVKYIVIY